MQLAWQAMVGYGHFHQRTVKEVVPTAFLQPLKPFQHSESVMVTSKEKGIGILKTIQKIWKEDKILAVGSIGNIVLPAMAGIEAWNKRYESGREAKSIMKSALIGMSLATASNIYTFQRIAKSNFSNEKRYVDRLKEEQKQQPKEKMLASF